MLLLLITSPPDAEIEVQLMNPTVMVGVPVKPVALPLKVVAYTFAHTVVGAPKLYVLFVSGVCVCDTSVVTPETAPLLNVTPPTWFDVVAVVVIVPTETAPLLNVTPPTWFDVVAVVVIAVVFNNVPLYVKVPLDVPEIEVEVPLATRMKFDVNGELSPTPAGPVGPVGPVDPTVPGNPVGPVGPVDPRPGGPVNPVVPVGPVNPVPGGPVNPVVPVGPV
jgi:hypothetical protein